MMRMRTCGSTAIQLALALVAGTADAATRAEPDTLVVPLFVSAPPESLRLGQPFDLIASVPVAGVHGLALLTPEEALAPFELRSWQRGLDRGDTAQVTLTLQAFDVGPLVLPPLVIAGESPDGNVYIARGDSIRVSVRAIVPADAKEIHDIHEAIPPVEPRPRWPWIVAGALLLALALAWLLRRSRGHGGAFDRVAAARPAHELALDALAALAEGPEASSGSWKAYYTELTSIVRAYLARRFGVDAMDMTTSETLRATEPLDLADAPRGALRTVLRAADAVKFARGEPAEGAPLRHLEDARRFVRLTMPVETVSAPAGAVAAAGGGRS